MAKREFDKKRYLACALEALQIQNWQVNILDVDYIEEDENAVGECESNVPYRWSEVRIVRNLTDEDAIRSTLCHEACHVLHAPVDYAANYRIIDDYVKKQGNKDRCFALYRDANESYIVQLSKIIRPHVDALYDKPKPIRKVTKNA